MNIYDLDDTDNGCGDDAYYCASCTAHHIGGEFELESMGWRKLAGYWICEDCVEMESRRSGRFTPRYK